MTDVEQIEAVLRSDLPEPSPAFAAELDRQVREGFPKPPRRRPVWLRPALAGAAVLVVVAAVAISVIGGGGERTGSTAALKAAPKPRALGDANSASSQPALTVAQRRVER